MASPRAWLSREKEARNAGQDRETAQVHGCRAPAQARGQEDPDRDERAGAREDGEQAEVEEEGLIAGLLGQDQPSAPTSSLRSPTTTAAPAPRSAASSTPEPAVTAIGTMPAATAATMSQVESPTYQQWPGSTPSCSAASSNRSGSGFACSTWLASTIRGSSSKPSAFTEVCTCSLRLDVAIAQSMPR